MNYSAIAAFAAAEAQKPKCTWTYSGDDYSSWDTTCARTFCMTEDTPKKNDYNFCPGCGGELIEVMPVDPPDEDSQSDGGSEHGK